MKNIIDILKDCGIEVPAEKVDDLNRSVSENYKSVAEFNKKIEKLEGERDAQKKLAEDAAETLKSFDGIDPDKIKDELAQYQHRAEQAEKEYAEKLEARDFNDALDKELSGIKFSSAAAEKSIRAEIAAAGLKMKDGKILGFSDLVAQMRADDASAFADDGTGVQPARFTEHTSNHIANGGTAITKKQIMDIKDSAERYAKIRENLHLYQKGN